jgi:hypothetical protein
MVSPVFVQKFWGAVSCPVLAIETPASTAPPTERAERVGWFGGEATLVELPTSDPAEIVTTADAWWARGGGSIR